MTVKYIFLSTDSLIWLPVTVRQWASKQSCSYFSSPCRGQIWGLNLKQSPMRQGSLYFPIMVSSPTCWCSLITTRCNLVETWCNASTPLGVATVLFFFFFLMRLNLASTIGLSLWTEGNREDMKYEILLHSNRTYHATWFYDGQSKEIISKAGLCESIVGFETSLTYFLNFRQKWNQWNPKLRWICAITRSL